MMKCYGYELHGIIGGECLYRERERERDRERQREIELGCFR